MRITFTNLEYIYLDDLLAWHDDDPRLHASRDLLLRLGYGFLNHDSVEVELSEEDLWLLRDASRFSARIGNEAVGLAVKTKLYEALRAFEIDEDDVSTVEHAEMPTYDITAKLGEWKEKHASKNKARRRTKDDPGTTVRS